MYVCMSRLVLQVQDENDSDVSSNDRYAPSDTEALTSARNATFTVRNTSPLYPLRFAVEVRVSA